MPHFPASQRYALPWRAIEMRRQREMLAHTAEVPASPGSPTATASSRSDRRIDDSPPASDLTRPVTDQGGFGAQGGDPSRVVNMDLSTCVNRYGPAPAAIAALHSIEPADILLHPYEAAPAGLLAVAVAHPAATLVVDESCIDFTPDPAGWSVIGCEVPNIV